MTATDLDRLGTALTGTPLAQALRPGLTFDAAAAVRVGGHPLPPPVVAWFTWHDGADGGLELLPDGVPLPAAQAVEVARLRREVAAGVAAQAGLDAPIGWVDSWLPLLAAPEEAVCWVVDCAEADGPVWQAEAEDPDPTVAFLSVGAMAKALATAYEQGELSVGRDGRVRWTPIPETADVPPVTAEEAALLDLLHDDDEDEAWDAADAIEARLHPGFMPGLAAAAVALADPWMRRRMVLLLLATGAAAALPPVLRALATDPHPEVRIAATGVTLTFPTRQVCDALLAAADDSEPAVQSAAITSLSHVPELLGPDVVAALQARRQTAEGLVAAALDHTLGVLKR